MENIAQENPDVKKPVRSIIWLVIMIAIFAWLGSIVVAVPPALILLGVIFSQKLSYAGIVIFIEQHYWYFYILFALYLLGQVLGIRYGVNDVFRKSKIETERILKIVFGIAVLYAIFNFPRISAIDFRTILVSSASIIIPTLATWYFLKHKFS
ncbi:MAG: hypothetical protein AAB417_02030 [Patescibacteria group bacterium]